jgi:hypothetical protein
MNYTRSAHSRLLSGACSIIIQGFPGVQARGDASGGGLPINRNQKELV